jgi:hypothetical protein
VSRLVLAPVLSSRAAYIPELTFLLLTYCVLPSLSCQAPRTRAPSTTARSPRPAPSPLPWACTLPPRGTSPAAKRAPAADYRRPRRPTRTRLSVRHTHVVSRCNKWAPLVTALHNETLSRRTGGCAVMCIRPVRTGHTCPTSTATVGHRTGLSENPRTASSGPKSALLAGPELLLTLGKQTSALGLKAASQVGGKVGGFVSDLKDNITSNLASATGTEQCYAAKRRACVLSGRDVPTCYDNTQLQRPLDWLCGFCAAFGIVREGKTLVCTSLSWLFR